MIRLGMFDAIRNRLPVRSRLVAFVGTVRHTFSRTLLHYQELAALTP